MIGIANIRRLKGMDNINAAYGITEKSAAKQIPAVSKPVLNKPRQKPIPKKSGKQKAVDRELKKLSDILLAKYPDCQIKSPACTGKAVCCHHVYGRGKIDFLNPKKLKTSCSACNTWVEQNDKEARKQGYKKSKF